MLQSSCCIFPVFNGKFNFASETCFKKQNTFPTAGSQLRAHCKARLSSKGEKSDMQNASLCFNLSFT